MKSSLVPIACGSALALMTGAAASHWCAVRDMVQLASMVPAAPAAPPLYTRPAAAPLPDERVAREAKNVLAEMRGTPEKAMAPAPESKQQSSSGAVTDARLEKVLTALESAVGQNQELRDRLADTNRDVMELRFQVDSFHGQFRPLKVEEDAKYYDDGSGGVLPPLDAQ
jgi:hypothetical protein